MKFYYLNLNLLRLKYILSSKKDLFVMIGTDIMKHQLNKLNSLYYNVILIVPYNTVFLYKKFTLFLIHNPHLT